MAFKRSIWPTWFQVILKENKFQPTDKVAEKGIESIGFTLGMSLNNLFTINSFSSLFFFFFALLSFHDTCQIEYSWSNHQKAFHKLFDGLASGDRDDHHFLFDWYLATFSSWIFYSRHDSHALLYRESNGAHLVIDCRQGGGNGAEYCRLTLC